MVLIILAVVWALYLLSWLRGHAESRRKSSNSIASFSQHLSVLERTRPSASAPEEPTIMAVPPRRAPASTVTALAAARDRRVEETPATAGSGPVRTASAPRRVQPSISTQPPRTRAEVQRRRREVLFFLGGLNLVALAAALALGGIGIAFLAVSAALAGGYLYLLSQVNLRANERQAKVHYLHAVEGEDFDDAWYEDDNGSFDERYLARSGT